MLSWRTSPSDLLSLHAESPCERNRKGSLRHSRSGRVRSRNDLRHHLHPERFLRMKKSLKQAIKEVQRHKDAVFYYPVIVTPSESYSFLTMHNGRNLKFSEDLNQEFHLKADRLKPSARFASVAITPERWAVGSKGYGWKGAICNSGPWFVQELLIPKCGAPHCPEQAMVMRYDEPPQSSNELPRNGWSCLLHAPEEVSPPASIWTVTELQERYPGLAIAGNVAPFEGAPLDPRGNASRLVDLNQALLSDKYRGSRVVVPGVDVEGIRRLAQSRRVEFPKMTGDVTNPGDRLKMLEREVERLKSRIGPQDCVF